MLWKKENAKDIKNLKGKYWHFPNSKGECKYAECTFNSPLSCSQDGSVTKLCQWIVNQSKVRVQSDRKNASLLHERRNLQPEEAASSCSGCFVVNILSTAACSPQPKKSTKSKRYDSVQASASSAVGQPPQATFPHVVVRQGWKTWPGKCNSTFNFFFLQRLLGNEVPLYGKTRAGSLVKY